MPNYWEERYLKQYVLTCAKTIPRTDRKLAVFLNGWLMEHLDSDLVERFHQTGDNPFSIYIDEQPTMANMVFNALDTEMETIFDELLLNPNLQKFEFVSATQKEFVILNRTVRILTEKDLSRQFYQGGAEGWYDLKIISPITFKSQGYYQFMPDVRLFFQSLMRKYNQAIEKSEQIDIDLLDEICKKTQVVSYRLRTQRYFIHSGFVTGFLGNLTFRCHGSQTLKDYLGAMLSFGEFSGVGAKTSLGMGAIKLKNQKEENNGKAKS